MEQYQTFRSMSPAFHDAYFRWHSSGQYERVDEFGRPDDVKQRPPPRERDDWYRDELRVLDECYRRLAQSRVLEVGCGDGNLSWKLAQRCSSLVAWDIDPTAIELTRMRLVELGLADRVTLEARKGETVHPREVEAFDVVFFVQVLEHVPGWEQARLFDTVWSLVAPGGCLFVSTPNRWLLLDTHDTGKYFIHWLPRRIKVPIARRLGWGVKGHDPSWPYPPVVHDYVSFRWMLRRARRTCPEVISSQMSFYPHTEAWLANRSRRGQGGARWLARKGVAKLGRFVPLNYYFGSKAIFAKPAV